MANFLKYQMASGVFRQGCPTADTTEIHTFAVQITRHDHFVRVACIKLEQTSATARSFQSHGGRLATEGYRLLRDVSWNCHL
jgi:hypothetical protein